MAAAEKNLYTGTSASTVMYTDRRDFYIQPNVVKENYPDVTPFLTASANWNQIMYPKDPQYKMFQYDSPWRKQYFQVTTGTTSAADNAEDTLAVVITNAVGMPATLGNYLVGKKLTVYPNVDGKPKGAPKGQVLCTTFTSTTSINVKNMGSSSITIANDDWLFIEGSGFGEGSYAANPSFDDIKVVWNQAGIHKTAFQLTKTLMEASLRGESKEYERLKRVYGQIHMVQKERDMLFSRSSIGTNLTGADTFADGARTDVDGNVVRSTYGIFSAIYDFGYTSATAPTPEEQNIFDVNASSYSYTNWVDDSEKAFYFRPDGGVIPMWVSDQYLSYFNKIEGIGGKGFSATSKWSPGQIQFSDSKASKLGFSYRELESPHGTYQFIKLPVLTNSPMNGWAFTTDPAHVGHVVFRQPKYEQNIVTDNAPDFQKNQYFSDEGMWMTNLGHHKIFRIV